MFPVRFRYDSFFQNPPFLPPRGTIQQICVPRLQHSWPHSRCIEPNSTLCNGNKDRNFARSLPSSDFPPPKESDRSRHALAIIELDEIININIPNPSPFDIPTFFALVSLAGVPRTIISIFAYVKEGFHLIFPVGIIHAPIFFAAIKYFRKNQSSPEKEGGNSHRDRLTPYKRNSILHIFRRLCRTPSGGRLNRRDIN